MWIVAAGLPAATFLLGSAIHLYAVYLTFDAFGLFAAGAAFFGAFFAEAFWIYAGWKVTGQIFTDFTIACIVWIVLVIVMAYSRRAFG